MNKTRLLFLALPLLFSSLTGCSNQKGVLTYGTYINQSLGTLKELNNDQLFYKMDNQKETFILATYQSSHTDCTCYETYRNVIVSYMNTFHEQIYLFDTTTLDPTMIRDYKVESPNDSTLGLYVYKGKQQLAKYMYGGSNTNLFENPNGKLLHKYIHRTVSKPSLYYVDETYIDENLAKKDNASLLFVRGGCDDCKVVLPGVIIPYIEEHSLKNEIWVYDLQHLYDLSKSVMASEQEKEQYQNTKNKYGLSASNSETFGYKQGVVPTIQHYENGVLKDACVYFNDSLAQAEDGHYYVSDSYYTEERLPNLKYLKDAKIAKVVKGVLVEEEGVVKTESGGFFWNPMYAAMYHSPILEAFLKYYCK